MNAAAWETVIGLEVHCQLATKTKLFCRCSTSFGAAPNANTCPVCLALPGALPVLNEHAVELAIKAALAFGCAVQPSSQFARKNYFYPDLPKGYQISQYERPYALGGHIDVPVKDGAPKRVRLVRIHMEEDAGKNTHTNLGHSLVDYNRACTPLIEIVSEPDIRSADEAAEYFRRLRQVVIDLGVSDGNMEEGSLRCDVNISIRPRGSDVFGTRVELKNINSFKFIVQAIHYEEARQRDVLAGGGKVVQETRLWDADAGVTRSMRSKEDAQDYRYFPDPDLPALVITEAQLAKAKAELPELSHQRAERYVRDFKLPPYDAQVLTTNAAVARAFEANVASGVDAKQASNFYMGVVLRDLPSPSDTQSTGIGALLKLVADGTISGTIAKNAVWPEFLATGKDPAAIVAEKGLAQQSDSTAIEAAVLEVLSKNASQVTNYKGGNVKLLGFFVGQVMKATGGKANPAVVNELIKKHIG